MKIIFAALLALFATVAAGETLYSKEFDTFGVCTGKDELAVLTYKGPDGKPKHEQIVPPWENVPIKIVGVEIAVFEGKLRYVFSGNGYSPDIMLVLGMNETGKSHFFPPGLSFPLPASGSSAKPAHIDLHVRCDPSFWLWRKIWRSKWRIWYVIYYTKG